MSTETVLDEVRYERDYQKQKWGNDTDSLNSPHHWSSYIGHYTNRNLVGDPRNEPSLSEFRADMVKVAALAVAAIEAIDAKHV